MQPRETKLIQQRNRSDCGLAAMAMALGKEYDELWTPEDVQKVLDERGISDVGDWLERKGLKRREDFSTVYTFGREKAAELLWGRPALLSIVSLNEQQGNHLVYFDGYRIWDPQEGREGKLFARIIRSVSIETVTILHPRYAYTFPEPIRYRV